VTHRLRIEALSAKTDRIVGEALIRAESLEAEARRLGEADRDAWGRALAAAELAKDRMAGRSVRPIIADRVAKAFEATSKGAVRARELADRREADRALAEALDAARLEGALDHDGGFDAEATRVAYAKAFRSAGVDVDSTPDGAGAKRIASGEETERIAAALDDWARLEPDRDRRSRLDALARAIDPDPFRNRVRSALRAPDRSALEALAKSPEVSALPAASVRLLAQGLGDRGARDEAIALLEAAQRRNPADFWINFDLGKTLQSSNPVEAVRFLTAAVTARPDSPGARVAVGAALDDHGKPDKAEVAFRDAIRLSPNYADAHSNLGIVLDHQSKHDEGLAAHREAVRLDPEDADGQYNLGTALQGVSAFAEAASAYRQVLRLRPGDSRAAMNLGVVLKRQGRVREAVMAYRQALSAKPDDAAVRLNLGLALRDHGQLPESEVELREAERLDPNNPTVVSSLGVVLSTLGKHDEAVAACKRAVAMDPKIAASHFKLGLALAAAGKVDAAVAAYREAVTLDPEMPEARCNLGMGLMRQGKLQEALVELKAGHAIGSKRPGWGQPSKRWIADCERKIDLERNASALLKEAIEP